jgi:Putative zinc-finger
MHDEWTDRLSEYIDDELTADERRALEAHLAGCAECAAMLADLRDIVERANTMGPRPPQADLWPGISGKLASARAREPRRFSFTLAQLAAAAVLLIALSSAVAWQSAQGFRHVDTVPLARPTQEPAAPLPTDLAAGDALVRPVGLADAQYDAAVADLEHALAKGRGRLDKATIAIVEENLSIIDQAIAQARKALASDPSNSYLSSHLVEARRKKLDLLRRAAALTNETN